MPELDKEVASEFTDPAQDAPSTSLPHGNEIAIIKTDTAAGSPGGEEEEGRRLAKMPQLQGAQDLLKQQLQSMKAALEAQLRERQKEVKVRHILYVLLSKQAGKGSYVMPLMEGLTLQIGTVLLK